MGRAGARMYFFFVSFDSFVFFSCLNFRWIGEKENEGAYYDQLYRSGTDYGHVKKPTTVV